MTREPIAVDKNGKLVEWEEGVEDFAKTAEKVIEALMKRVLMLERDKRSVEGRLTRVEKSLGKTISKLDTIAMRHSD